MVIPLQDPSVRLSFFIARSVCLYCGVCANGTLQTQQALSEHHDRKIQLKQKVAELEEEDTRYEE